MLFFRSLKKGLFLFFPASGGKRDFRFFSRSHLHSRHELVFFASSLCPACYIVWQSVRTMTPRTMLGAAGKVLSFKAPERGQLFNFLSEFSRETNQKLRHGREFGTRRPISFSALLCTAVHTRNEKKYFRFWEQEFRYLGLTLQFGCT